MLENFKKTFRFCVENPEKVFTAIVILMLIFLSFVKIVLQIVNEYKNYSLETEEWKPLNIMGIKITLPSSMYITVVSLLLAMLFIHSNKIIHYWIVNKFGHIPETAKKEETPITENEDDFDYSGTKNKG